MNNKPVRYVVLHLHRAYDNSAPEEAWASYNAQLDAYGITALSMATHTARRYAGEIFIDSGDGVLHSFRSYAGRNKKKGVSLSND